MEAFISQANINGDLRFDGTRDSIIRILYFLQVKMKVIEQEGVALYKASVQENINLNICFHWKLLHME